MIQPADIAKQLISAEQERTAIDPFTDAYPGLTTEAGYAAQKLVVQSRLDRGERVIGAKLGLTSRAKQRVMNVDDPLHGTVTDRMIGEFGVPVRVADFIHPRVEPEIAFLLGRELAGPATVTSVLAATEALFAAIDVLDSRYHDFRFTLPDVVADNASAGLFLLGSAARPPHELEDLRLTGCVLRRGGEVVDTAAGAAVMGHPAASVAWLANRLAERGEVLPAGSIVFSGGLTAPIPLERGVAVTAEFDGLGVVETVGA